MKLALELGIPTLAALIVPAVTINYLYVYRISRVHEIKWLINIDRTKKHYEQNYGPENLDRVINSFLKKRDYILPLILVFGLVWIGAHISILNFSVDLGTDAHSFGAVFGFLGAYSWSMNNIVRRTKGFDLSPISVYLISVKITILSIVGYLISFIFRDSISWLLAFALGALPLTEVRRFILDVGTKNKKVHFIEVNSDSLSNLQGTNHLLRSKLEDFGITSIQNLAYCNIFELFLKCNVERKVILDLIDQALLWVFIEEKAVQIRPHGIRGAIELIQVNEDLKSPDRREKKHAEEMINNLSSELSIPYSSAYNLIVEIANDAQSLLLWDLWSSIHHDKNETDTNTLQDT